MKVKKPAKDERERLVLLGLIDLYLESGQPVGSNTLKEKKFDSLSSATIRNYFAKLEKAGMLKQAHASGGREPTAKGYQTYADTYYRESFLEERERLYLHDKLSTETKEIETYLQRAADLISERTGCAVFFMAPRFDRDFVSDVKLVGIDERRTLCVVVTDFGVVQSETLYHDGKLSTFALKRLEAYFHYKLRGLDRPELDESEQKLADHFYNEVMLRHITGSGHHALSTTGFSKLLTYPEFSDATSFAEALHRFEHPQEVTELLKRSIHHEDLIYDIGDHCSMVAVPYRIQSNCVGALGILGPSRLPYRKLFATLRYAAEALSATLTNSLFKFKITYRQPEMADQMVADTRCLLLENKDD